MRAFARIAVVVGSWLLAGPIALAAGTVPGFNLTPQFDQTGKLAVGCRLFIIQAGTTSSPQNAYQDSGLTTPWPNPLSCDAAGRLPQWFVADGLIKIRLTDKNGNQIFVGDNLLVVGPSSGGGGGGGTVDPTTIFQTGAFMQFYGTGILSGWVRANGRTIGSATSGASERANTDCQALFVYLWGADPNLAVSGGRGVSAVADWAANKTIALPDLRGRVLAGLGDMGNADAGRLTPTYFGATATTLGATGGAESLTLTTSQIPSHQHNIYLRDLGHVHGGALNTGAAYNSPGGATSVAGNATTNTSSSTTGITIGSVSGVANDNLTAAIGGGSAHRTVQPTILASTYLKL
jgi:microcystin-dependent protein